MRIFIVLVMLLSFLGNIPVHGYEMVGKEKLVYEINSAVLESDGITLSGWSFIGESQHFTDPSEFSGSIVIYNGRHELEYPLVFRELDMTAIMKLLNTSRCGDKQYNRLGRECYYDLTMVGWDVHIPLSDLMDDTRYLMKLQMSAHKTGEKYQTNVIFASESQSIHDSERDRVVSLNSGLDSTRLIVNHDLVLVRKNASEDSVKYVSLYSCSTTYGNVLYFIKYSTYLNVLRYQVVEDVTWYRIGIKEAGCYQSMAVVREGSIPAWIPSTFVDYNGTVATIDVVKNVYGPIIYLEDQMVYLGDTTFDPDAHVRAFDKQDGVIVPIQTSSNLNVNTVGRYYVEYAATNSVGITTTEIMYVDVVLEGDNTPPIITALSQVIYKGDDSFDPLRNVMATDLEDGDITDQIVVMNEIDIEDVGIQELCYYVEDSGGLSKELCVEVNVLPKVIDPIYQESNLRFIDKNRVFYQESIPSKWSSNYDVLMDVVESSGSVRRGTY
ncbi:MAG: DUF5011 domain-containing protein [Erysipelotrichaceae bacterium]|nr:DUF5011 domain-containing protein [Erysipelotrichaceae bacterium]